MKMFLYPSNSDEVEYFYVCGDCLVNPPSRVPYVHDWAVPFWSPVAGTVAGCLECDAKVVS